MGRNPLLKVYVSGYGENPMKYPHHRFFCPQADPLYPSVPPGFVASGPNSGTLDPWAYAGSKTGRPAAQTCYVDHVESFMTNSVTISLNAALAWVTYYLDGSDPRPSNTPTNPVTTIPTIPGVVEDINNDGTVNMHDVVIIAKAFGTVPGDKIFDKRCDLTNDNGINMADVMILALKFGFVYSV
ncbi:glycoside hydrolase family 9 [Pseudobacteroides cellulosolvens ATCC 35603 = DSM 2933]|uniref:Glycoside hydrolase family 9 n=2 Tax=Pseudobacteroides cellulosolvens TaxID=35825 RepID=A0A0L6JKE0_9FIRM|nr:glycoside hydrolase family 9 protein [Pseudobacteroides cellulosolvens]KNY25842.1 glycoside hydrolase family 9 [Pseudobacteroides cellulosolvens ATCC 35603 = DSM 2933]